MSASEALKARFKSLTVLAAGVVSQALNRAYSAALGLNRGPGAMPQGFNWGRAVGAKQIQAGSPSLETAPALLRGSDVGVADQRSIFQTARFRRSQTAATVESLGIPRIISARLPMDLSVFQRGFKPAGRTDWEVYVPRKTMGWLSATMLLPAMQ